MPNTNVFRGSDATLTLAVDTGAEGDAAQEIIELYQLSPVGRATSVDVYVNTELELFHELGRRHPAVLRPGNIEVSGKVGRAFINGALLRLLLGKGALTERENEPYPQPSFNLMLDLKDPATPDTGSTLTVHGVKFENWSYSLPEDDFVMEAVTFKGLFITVEDREG
ncbi:MAG TPA: hypothetical protein VF708_09295 [Pyrinomonadaceae bacterium]|jgi:hypothetical protein